MLLVKDNIIDFIPHRAPFVMVDHLISATRERFESDFYIEESNELVFQGLFQEGGLLENIAQTCAASFGYLDQADGSEPKIGYIGAISRVVLHACPPHSVRINTIVTPTHQLGNIFMVTGQNFLDGRLLLECEMKIVIA